MACGLRIHRPAQGTRVQSLNGERRPRRQLRPQAEPKRSGAGAPRREKRHTEPEALRAAARAASRRHSNEPPAAAKTRLVAPKRKEGLALPARLHHKGQDLEEELTLEA